MNITVEAIKWSGRGWVRDVRRKEKIMKPSHEPLCKLTFFYIQTIELQFHQMQSSVALIDYATSIKDLAENESP